MRNFYVYMFLNELELPLYIGISTRLVQRIEKQHFKSKSGNLSKECIEETHKIKYHQATSEDDMKIKERYLINTLNPKYNNKMNNGNNFNFSISFDWEEYNFNKEELIKKREKNENQAYLKFRNYKYDFQNQKVLKLNTIRTLRVFCTCIGHNEKYYPNIDFPKKNPWGGYCILDDFYFLKINNELYIFCRGILNFYYSYYPGNGDVVYSIDNINELRSKYGKNAFVVVDCKEKLEIFKGDFGMEKLPNQVLFMKYDIFKTTEFIQEEWISLIDKGLINFNKPLYEWLLGRFLTKEEHNYAEEVSEEEIKKLYDTYIIKKL